MNHESLGDRFAGMAESRHSLAKKIGVLRIPAHRMLRRSGFAVGRLGTVFIGCMTWAILTSAGNLGSGGNL